MPTEEWRPVPGHPDYQASDLGRVMSLKAYRGDPGPRILRGTRRRDGYLEVGLSSNGSVARRLVHSLVAEAFYGDRPDGQQVRHLDGDRLNNKLSNLCYGTQTENNLDAVRHGTNRNAAKRRCLRDHPFDDVNTGFYKNGYRYCRACRRITSAARRASRALCAAGVAA